MWLPVLNRHKTSGGAREKGRLVAVEVFAKPAHKIAENALRIAKNTADNIGLNERTLQKDIEVRGEFDGGAYGRFREFMVVMIQKLALTSGVSHWS